VLLGLACLFAEASKIFWIASPFRAQPRLDQLLRQRPEIQSYLTRTFQKYNLSHDVKLGHEITHAYFDHHQGIWNLKVSHNGRAFDDWCNVLVPTTDFFSHWRWREIPGLYDFEGVTVHSAAGDEGFHVHWEEDRGCREWEFRGSDHARGGEERGAGRKLH
jgi:hypothetical protein